MEDPILEMEIKDLIVSLYNNKTPGQDGFLARFYTTLTAGCSQLMTEGIIPQIWTQSKLMRILKPEKEPSSPAS